jgi:hypothetical protein
MTRKDWLAVMLTTIAFFAFVWAAKPAHAHGPYTHWLIPGTAASCCNEKMMINGEMTGDCYPTTAELRPSADKSVKGVVWWAKRDNGEWVEIPEKSILHELNPDETGQKAHLCYSDTTLRVLCFVPPVDGS